MAGDVPAPFGPQKFSGVSSRVLSLRPKAAELVFQVFGRPLHPELYEPCVSRAIDRGSYSAHVVITGSGHVVTWRQAGTTLTEVAAAAKV